MENHVSVTIQSDPILSPPVEAGFSMTAATLFSLDTPEFRDGPVTVDSRELPLVPTVSLTA